CRVRVVLCRYGVSVRHAGTVNLRHRRMNVRTGDAVGLRSGRFYHFSRPQEAPFRTGSVGSAYGDVRPGPVGVEMVHPEYRILKEGESPVLKEALTPVYPATEGVQQGRLRSLTDQALKIMQIGRASCREEGRHVWGR